MYLSSRISTCVGIVAVLATFAAGGASRAELAARPAFAGIRPTIVTRGPRVPYSGIAPTLVGRHDGYPAAGIRPTLVPRYRRGHGSRYGYGGYGYGGYGFGSDSYGDVGYGAAGAYPPAPGPIDAPPAFAFPPQPAPCPQIIEIGGGLAHKASTHVVAGTPCRR